MADIKITRSPSRPVGGVFYEELATNPAIRSKLHQDSRLTVDQFASTHAETIRSHYARFCHFDAEDARYLASVVWYHLRTAATAPPPDADR